MATFHTGHALVQLSEILRQSLLFNSFLFQALQARTFQISQTVHRLLTTTQICAPRKSPAVSSLVCQSLSSEILV